MSLRTRSPTYVAIAALGALLAAWCATPLAQQPSGQSSAQGATSTERSAAKGQSDGKLARRDRRFIEKSAQGNLAEVETGKLATTKAASEDVKKFGDQMVQDHGKANEELQELAQSKGVNLPGTLDRSHRRMESDLAKRSGADFDRRYMADMVRDHERDLKEHRNAAKNAKDPDVKAYAEKASSMISRHLDMAKQIAAKVGAPTGGGKGARSGSSTGSSASKSGGADTSSK